jgi:hypothetical protein
MPKSLGYLGFLKETDYDSIFVAGAAGCGLRLLAALELGWV